MFDKNLLLRALSALVGLPLVGLLVVWDQRWGFALLTFAMMAIALSEYTNMSPLRGRSGAERGTLVVAGVVLGLAIYARPDFALTSLIVVALAVGAAQLFFATDMPTAGARFGATLAGLLYVPLLLTALPLLQRDATHGESWVFVALGVTFSCDTGAYFAGRALGKRKLAPAISPGKTWAGFWGGVASAMLFVFIARQTFFPTLSLVDVAVVGGASAVLGPAGDLVESMLKRSSGVKDSGNVIPGHGGVLDRVDALLFVGGFVYVYAAQLRAALGLG
ncbi:MAG: phosphatidate cytidylyltransferase [Deltaproteobacteria bacterium]|nr:phosphatidate cytidylyltransferase [Deltaproteobacteria bacterium]